MRKGFAIMNFQSAVTTCLQKYADFSGRAARPEYWWFFLFIVIVSIVLTIIDLRILGTANLLWGFGLLNGVFTLAILLPAIGVGVRRLHDLDKPGWWLLLSLIPIVGPLVLIYWFVQRGSGVPNQYGPPPGH